MIMMVIDDENKEKVVEIIKQSAHTGKYGDGKIFINPIESSYTIRTGEEGI
jgi:nitrogen regulatory protein PII 1